MKELTKSKEDYLESIYIQELHGERIRSVKIATDLHVSKPAVNRAMNELADDGLISKSDYSDIVLTEFGRTLAKEIYGKHELLRTFLIQLGVSKEVAEIDCCRLEHILSNETLKCISKYVKENKA